MVALLCIWFTIGIGLWKHHRRSKVIGDGNYSPSLNGPREAIQPRQRNVIIGPSVTVRLTPGSANDTFSSCSGWGE